MQITQLKQQGEVNVCQCPKLKTTELLNPPYTPPPPFFPFSTSTFRFGCWEAFTLKELLQGFPVFDPAVCVCLAADVRHYIPLLWPSRQAARQPLLQHPQREAGATSGLPLGWRWYDSARGRVPSPVLHTMRGPRRDVQPEEPRQSAAQLDCCGSIEQRLAAGGSP